MKRYIIVSVAVFAGLMGVASLSYAMVQGSAHDFTGPNYDFGADICLPCHTPHNPVTNPDGLLWNHKVSSPTYMLYTHSTLDALMPDPDGQSKLCLSCHDGTVALDSFGRQTGGTNAGKDALPGIDLRKDHPVSLYWNHQTSSSGYESGRGGDCTLCHKSPPVGDPLRFFESYIECATCHDVHNNAGLTSLLRMTLDRSAICLQCHDK